jgi:hypothetical protein
MLSDSSYKYCDYVGQHLLHTKVMWKDMPHLDSLQEHHAQTSELAEAHSYYAEVQQLVLVLIIHLLLVLILISGAVPPLLCAWSFLIKYSDNLPCLVDKYEHTDISCFWQSCLTNRTTKLECISFPCMTWIR